MTQLDKLVTLITSLDRRTFTIYLGAVLGCIAALSCALLYWLYSTRAAQIVAWNKLNDQVERVQRLAEKHDRISREEDRIQGMLEENKGFSIKTFFEKFCSEHGVTAESGWDTEQRSLEGNDSFDEVILNATFKNQTTQSLVTLVGSINNTEIVYIKNIEIKNDGNRSISFNLTIATKKRKQFWED